MNITIIKNKVTSNQFERLCSNGSICSYPPDASSEYLSTVDLTDSEDAGRNGSVVTGVQDMTGSQVALLGGSYTGLSPMIIMNNFVLKQVKYSNSFLPHVVYVNTHLGCCP